LSVPFFNSNFNQASEDNQFVLKDGHPLHLVKVVGAVVHYHEYWNNDVIGIGIEDGNGKFRVVLARCQNLECSGVKELYRKCTINTYVRVIGMVKDDFNLRTIPAPPRLICESVRLSVCRYRTYDTAYWLMNY